MADARGPAKSGGLLLIVTDVTSLKRAERALREKESLLRSFYESSAMAMGVVELIERRCPARLGQRADRSVLRAWHRARWKG